jgi:hypothetical protein
MVWTTASNVRLLTGLSTTDISDEDLNSLVESAQKEVLLQINHKVIREEVEYIDETRENSINGSNTTFYIRNWKGNYLSDMNYDLDVTKDDIKVYSINQSTGVETEATVSSIAYDSGKFILSSAPNNVNLEVTYCYSELDPKTPDAVLKLATEFLAGSYIYTRIDSSQKKKVKFGNVEITNGTGSESASVSLYNKYLDLIRQLNESSNSGGAIWGESYNLI